MSYMPSQTLIFPVAIAHFGLISSSGSQQRPRTPVLLDNFDVIAKKKIRKENENNVTATSADSERRQSKV